MLFFLGILYLLFGFFFLIIPLVFIELGRPRDFIKAGIILLLGIYLIIKQNLFNSSLLVISILNASLFGFFLFEIFTNRWNQLLEKEKNNLKTFSELSKNFLLFIDAINLGFAKIYKNFNKVKLNQNLIGEKRWVRSNENNIISTSSKNDAIASSIPLESTNTTKEDIISDDKI